MKSALNPSRAHEVLGYDPEIGKFIWKERRVSSQYDVSWNKKYAGKEAGNIQSNGYLRIAIDANSYLAHRLAFLLMTGVFPDVQLDHIDGNRLNNKWKNLRRATNAQNQMNRKSTASSGIKGVYINNNRHKKYYSRIQIGDKTYELGSFYTAEEAAAAYAQAAREHHGEFARTK